MLAKSGTQFCLFCLTYFCSILGQQITKYRFGVPAVSFSLLSDIMLESYVSLSWKWCSIWRQLLELPEMIKWFRIVQIRLRLDLYIFWLCCFLYCVLLQERLLTGCLFYNGCLFIFLKYMFYFEDMRGCQLACKPSYFEML